MGLAPLRVKEIDAHFGSCNATGGGVEIRFPSHRWNSTGGKVLEEENEKKWQSVTQIGFLLFVTQFGGK